ncbi:MAG: N(4)-(beta-N-acetylglucosaminyl)-L-asparaginase [Bacteroidales bacterium]
MYNRRKFLLSSLAASIGISMPLAGKHIAGSLRRIEGSRPAIISTWNHGLAANAAAWEQLAAGRSVLDAVETGVRVSEADPEVTSVGFGGLPDSSGEVTLDACIMNPAGDAGAVACLKNILHPISVARLVMEETPHVMLVGEGALEFAMSNGFQKANLLTPDARKAWEKWKKNQEAGKPVGTGHDTIGMLALDAEGDLAGACTTSGLGFKLPGRVGDSPIIGAGLYVDNEVGGAAATGVGELVMKTLGSFLVVEMMRTGISPEEACRMALERIAEKIPLKPDMQVGFIAINKAGETAGFGLRKSFEYAVMKEGRNQLLTAGSFL